MQNILEQLFNGELYPGENVKVTLDGYQDAKKEAMQAYNKFVEKLCPEMKKEMDEWFSKESDASAFHDTQIFIDGFKLGARMMLEIMEDNAK